jgi:pimeloyl-ACP methyl ester carboxylesterase
MVLTGAAGIRKPQTEEGRRRAEAFQKTKVWIARMRRMKIFGTLPDELERQAREKYGSRDYNALDDEMRKTFVKVISLDLTDALPDITVPTLLIWGDQDTETPLWMGRKMEELIPDAGLVVFEGGTHFAYLEQNARFNTITHHFFVEE